MKGADQKCPDKNTPEPGRYKDQKEDYIVVALYMQTSACRCMETTHRPHSCDSSITNGGSELLRQVKLRLDLHQIQFRFCHQDIVLGF